MKLLTISTLYPNSVDPKHGIFVQTRLRHLVARHQDIDAKVIAPIPWFPFASERFGAYAKYAKAARRENLNGVDVLHPRYLVIPKIGMLFTPFFLFLAILFSARKLRKEGFDFDLVDGHYFYPDGVSIAAACKILGKPFTVTSRGTDLNLIPQFRLPRKMIQWTINQCDHAMAVCEALRTEIIKLGAPKEKATTLRNGVDLQLFQPIERKQRTSADKKILSVGHLVERKGHHLVIEAVAKMQGVSLDVIGAGEEQHNLNALVERLGCQNKVRFLGAMGQTELATHYGSADLLVLASDREGWANVLLEAMACGTPVVATNIWGTPEVVDENVAGVLVERSAIEIRKGIEKALERNFNRIEVRNYAEKFTWDATSDGQYSIFNRLMQEA